MRINPIQLDFLTEMINIGIGRGANVLNTMLKSHIQLRVPSIKILTSAELIKELNFHKGEKLSAVNLEFDGNISGNAELIFPSESASSLVTIFTGGSDEQPQMDETRAGALCEIGNVVLNAVMGSISNMLKLNFNYTVPNYLEGLISALFSDEYIDSVPAILLARTRFNVQEMEIEGDIVLLFKMGSFDRLLAAIEKETPAF